MAKTNKPGRHTCEVAIDKAVKECEKECQLRTKSLERIWLLRKFDLEDRVATLRIWNTGLIIFAGLVIILTFL